eukprot:TRINITY_DN27194_c0_g2_i1.p1 TRINITY_DN27194_c0_g2~~TRINITY_DN27194_c0_g2_i1.p1  ORF type:complete len:2812 (-),score=793.77 TRINITY_DN27194_c0_g2_i1:64-8499(-)
MAPGDGALKAGPHLDDELRDLESRFVELADGFQVKSERHRAQGDPAREMQGALPQHLYVPPWPELRGDVQELRGGRDNLIRELAKLPDWPPRPRLLAERIRREVNAAADSACCLEDARRRLRNFYLRRRAGLRGEQALVVGRLSRFVRARPSTARCAGPIGRRLAALQADLEATEARLRRLEKVPGSKEHHTSASSSSAGISSSPGSLPVAKANTGENLFPSTSASNTSTLSCVFRNDVVVCLRLEAFEERSTRLLRRFLAKMQHLPVSHRLEIYKRTLELASRTSHWPAAGLAEEEGQDRLPTLCPLKVRLDVAAKELGARLGILGSLKADNGRAYSSTVLLEFPTLFDKQSERLQFQSYPTDDALLQDESRGDPADAHWRPPAPMDSTCKPLLKESHWMRYVILTPNVETKIVEQRELLRTLPRDEAQGPAAAPLEVLTKNQRAVKEKLEARKSRSLTSSDFQEQPEVACRSRIREEFELLRSSDAKAALDKLHKKACNAARVNAELERARSTEKQMGSTGSIFGGASIDIRKLFAHNTTYPSEQQVYTYYMLGFLRARNLRLDLLSLLNRFRYTQQKVARGALAAQVRDDLYGEGGEKHGAGSSRHSRSSSPFDFFDTSISREDDVRQPSPASTQASTMDPNSLVNRPSGYPPPTLPSACMRQPRRLPVSAAQALEKLALGERLGQVDGQVLVCDERGLAIQHAVALTDLEELETDMISTATYFAWKSKRQLGPPAEDEDALDDPDERPLDLGAMVLDVLEAETLYHQAKWELVEQYLEVYEHVAEPAAQQALAQRIVDVMAQRPLLDLDAPYFVDAYASAITALQSRVKLLNSVVRQQLHTERQHVCWMAASDVYVEASAQRQQQLVGQSRTKQSAPHLATSSMNSNKRHSFLTKAMRVARTQTLAAEISAENAEERPDPQLDLTAGVLRPQEGFPCSLRAGHRLRSSPGVDSNVYDILEVFASLGLAWQVDLLVEEGFKELTSSLTSRITHRGALECACVDVVIEEWESLLNSNPEHTLGITPEGLAKQQLLEDPSVLLVSLEEALQRLNEHDKDEHSGEDSEDGDAAPAEIQELRAAFADLADRPVDERMLQLYVNLLEQVTVQRKLDDAVAEVAELRRTLCKQAKLVGSKELQFAAEPLSEFQSLRLPKMGTKAPPQPVQASSVDADFGDVGCLRGHMVVLHCAQPLVQQLRAVYQHELANRWLFAMCAMYNAILLNDLAKQQVEADVAVAERLRKREADSEEGKMQSIVRELQQLQLGKSPRSVFERLRAAAAMSEAPPPPDDGDDAGDEAQQSQPEEPPVVAAPSASALARTGTRCQWPLASKGPMRAALSSVIRERLRGLREQMAAQADKEASQRLCRAFKTRFLTHYSCLLAEQACELAVRVQAARSAEMFQGIVGLIPRALSPFRFSTEEVPKALISDDCSIDSIFHVPRAADMLVLRGLCARPTDMVRTLLERESQLPPLTASALQVVPHLSLSYHGPAYIGLLLLLAVAPLTASFIFANVLKGDPTTILRLHAAVANASFEDQRSGAAAATVLSAEEADSPSGEGNSSSQKEAWDAMEGLRLNFMNLAAQLDLLNCSRADILLSFLGSRVKGDAWRQFWLLKLSEQASWEKEDITALAELRRWQRYLTGQEVEEDATVMRLQSAKDDELEEEREVDSSPPGAGGDDDQQKGPGPEGRPSSRTSVTEKRPLWNESLQHLLLPRPCSQMVSTGLLSVGPPGGADAHGRRTRLSVAESMPRSDCPYLHRAVHALLADFGPPEALKRPFREDVWQQQWQGESSTDLESRIHVDEPLPHWGRFYWRLPQLPLAQLTRGLCLVPRRVRKRVLECQLHMEMKLDTYLTVREASAREPQSAAIELDFLRTVLQDVRLRELMLCSLSRSTLPWTLEEKYEYDRRCDQRIEKFMSTAKAVQQDKDSKEGENAPTTKFRRPSALLEDNNAERVAVRWFLRDTESMMSRELREIHKVLLGYTIACFEDELEILDDFEAKESVNDDLAASMTTITEKDRAATSQDRRRKTDAKLQAVAAFNQLRARAARVRTRGHAASSQSGCAYVVLERDLEDCVQQLGRSLLHWGRSTLELRDLQSARGSKERGEALWQGQQRAAYGRAEGVFLRQKIESHVLAGVADRGGRKQLLELDGLHGRLRALAGATFEMESRYAMEVQTALLYNVTATDNQLMEVIGKNEAYLQDMRSALVKETRNLKEGLLEQLHVIGKKNFAMAERLRKLREEWAAEPAEAAAASAASASASVVRHTSVGAASASGAGGGGGALQQGIEQETAAVARHPAAVACLSAAPTQAAEVEELHVEIGELEHTCQGLTYLLERRFQRERTVLENELHNFRTTLSSNMALLDKCAGVRERGLIVDGELDNIKRAAHQSARITEQLNRMLHREQHNITKLTNWRETALKRFSVVLREARKYEQLDHFDLNKLEGQLNKLTVDIHKTARHPLDFAGAGLVGTESSRAGVRCQIEKERAAKQQNTWKRALAEEERLTRKAKTKAELIRREVECGESVENDSLLGRLSSEYSYLQAAIEAANKDIRRLKEDLPEALYHGDGSKSGSSGSQGVQAGALPAVTLTTASSPGRRVLLAKTSPRSTARSAAADEAAAAARRFQEDLAEKLAFSLGDPPVPQASQALAKWSADAHMWADVPETRQSELAKVNMAVHKQVMEDVKETAKLLGLTPRDEGRSKKLESSPQKPSVFRRAAAEHILAAPGSVSARGSGRTSFLGSSVMKPVVGPYLESTISTLGGSKDSRDSVGGATIESYFSVNNISAEPSKIRSRVQAVSHSIPRRW